MHPPALKTAVRRIRSLAGPPDTQTDRDLLARFQASRDDRAFAALVCRHGPAVLGVCRRVLVDPHAAEDAFQATFLVLARRAASVRKAASLGCWLHGVAFRVSNKLKGRLARQPRSVELSDVPGNPRDDVLWRDVRRVLDEEVNRLPERLRLPVFLCYFEGKTRDEAAEALGWKLTTLRGRLEDGRLRLRARLTLRGVELSAALLAVSAAADGLAVGDSLFESTVRMAGGAASESIQSLAKGIVMTGALGKAKLTVGALLLAIGLGTTLLVYRGEAGETPVPGPVPKPAETPKDKVPPSAPAKPVEYGDAAGDFRIRLHQPGKLKVGESPELLLDVKYAGKEERTIPRQPEYAEVEVDGKWFVNFDKTLVEVHVDRFAAGIEWPKWLTVRPDSTWGHLRDKPDAAGDPGEATKELIPFRLTAGAHTLRLAYRFGKDERAVSNAVTVEVAADGWGDPSGGVKARLRIANTKLKPGDPLVFDFDLKNEGRKTWNPLAIPFDCEIYLDDERYAFSGALDYKAATKELKPGGELVPFVTPKVDSEWMIQRRPMDGPEETKPAPAEPVHFRLSPGKHKVRVAFPIEDKKVRPVSNAVEIDVEALPLDAATRAMALGADRIWVVSSPTREKPVPEPVEVLKGPPEGKPSVFDLRLLPADDPKKKWIVFLLAEEEGKPVPDVKVWQWAQWSRPYTPEMAEGIRQAILPTAWGEERDGLQLGLRLRSSEVTADNPVVAEVTIRNVGKVAKTIDQHRFNIYDYWPRTWFEVTWPDGTKWLMAMPVGKIKESDAPTPITLKPGETYIQAMRVNRWLAPPIPPKDGVGPPHVFSKAGEYTIACLYTLVPVGGEGTWTAALASNAVKVTVKEKDVKAPEWGEAIGGVRARVRLAKAKLAANEELTFDLDLRNEGTKTWKPITAFYHCEIVLDGRRYEYAGAIGHPVFFKELKPGAELVPFLTATVNSQWVTYAGSPKDAPRTGPGTPFLLPAGKHKLAVSYPLEDGTRVVARTVEFEVTSDGWGEAASGMQARVRLAKQKFKAGEPLAFEFDLKNTGDKTYEDGPIPMFCWIELDGDNYQYSAPLGYPTSMQKLEPGKEYVPYVKVATNEWWTHVANEGRGPAVPLALTPGKHTLRVSYPLPGNVKPVSPKIELEVVADEWGEAVGGVRARLRLAKTTFKAGEPFAFELDLKNTGEQTYEEGPIPQNCEVELDGAMFKYTGPINITTPVFRLTPGKEFVPFVTATADRLWLHSGTVVTPFVLTPGKHKVRVSYPLPGKVKPVSPPVEFEVVTDEAKAPDLATLTATADRIVVATIDWQAGQPRLKPKRALKGPNNRWQPDVQPLTVPAGTEPLPNESRDPEWILFLRVDEDNVEVPKLSPAAVRGWFRSATDKEIEAVLAALPKPTEQGTVKNGLSLALRPTTTTVRVGEDVRLEVVLTNTTKETLRVLQQRYNVYDYWPFLTFTVTLPDGQKLALARSEGPFAREDYIDDVGLKAGAGYAHTVRLNRWPAVPRKMTEDLGLPAFAFGVPGTYKVEATYKAAGFKNIHPTTPLDDWPFWSGELTSNTITVEVKPAAK